jgi:hypothetical protein
VDQGLTQYPPALLGLAGRVVDTLGAA